MQFLRADPRIFDTAMPPHRRRPLPRHPPSPLGNEKRPVCLVGARVYFRHSQPVTAARITVDPRATRPLQRDGDVLVLPPHTCGSAVVSGNCLPLRLYIRLPGAGISIDTRPTPTLDGQTYRGTAFFGDTESAREFPIYLRVDATHRIIDVFTCAERDDPPVSMQLTLSFAALGIGDSVAVDCAVRAFASGGVVAYF